MQSTLLQQNAQLSTFSNLAYLDNPPDSVNGWSLFESTPAGSGSGFSAVAYKGPDGQVMIAFRGTDGLSDLAPDGAFVAGAWHPQFSEAAAFTAGVKSEMKKFDITGDLMVTGHSLGGGIAQAMGQMFNLKGATFDAPGAAGVTQSEGFAQTAAQYGQAANNMVGENFTNYSSQNSLISAVDTHLGSNQSIVNMSDPSMAPLLAGAVGMLGGPVLATLGFTAVANIMDTHPAAGIERAMWASAAISEALDVGALKLTNMSWAQATGKPWPYEGVSQQTVPVFTDASGKVVAVAAKNGDYWTISSPDQSTVVTLMPASEPGSGLRCLVETGDNQYECSIFQGNNNVVALKKDMNGDGQTDFSSTSQKLGNGGELEQIKGFDETGLTVNEQLITTSASGSVSARISGTGAQVDLSGASITLDDGTSATLNGSQVQISLGAHSTAVVNGTDISVAGAAGASLTANGNTHLSYDEFGNPTVIMGDAQAPSAAVSNGGVGFSQNNNDGTHLQGQISQNGWVTTQSTDASGNSLTQSAQAAA